MLNILIMFIAFIFAIGILVTFHEFGHFWVARQFGVKVLRFSVGFGKPLWRKHDRHKTEYVLAAIPLGGYVKMLDEREGPVSHEQLKHAFNRKSVWVRFCVVLAGPFFNFIFAIFAYWLMYMIGITGWIPQIGEIIPESIAAHAGLQAQDEVITVDHQATYTWQQVAKQLMNRLGDKDILEIEAKKPDGTLQTYYLNLKSWELKGEKPNLLHSLGIEPYRPPVEPILYEVLSGEPADQAGLLPGDKILSANGKSISHWHEFSNFLRVNIDKPIVVSVERKNEVKSFTINPRIKESDTGEIVGFVGVMVKVPPLPESMLRHERLGPIEAFTTAIQKTMEYILISFKMIGKMIIGEIGLKTISGPITIAQGAGATAVVGLQYYLGFLAVISIGLGVINLLPIPVLDGGHLLFYFYEMIAGKPLPDKIQELGYKIGMLFLIFLMSIAFYNDLIRLM